MSATTKMLRTAAAIFGLVTMAGCSKPKPLHPNAGLTVTYNGQPFWTCGFFYRAQDGIMEPHASEMGASGDHHEVKVFWSLRPEAAGDVYHLRVIADGVTTEREITYSGRPVVVVEKPLRVIVEEMRP